MTNPLKQQMEQARLKAESDLEWFIKLIAPERMLSQCHLELIRWWTRDKAKSHQLVLLPRDHQKSALVAFRVAWEITKNPALRVLYISSTSNLAVKQLKFIKDILTSEIYRKYWPLMVNPDEGRREKWTETEISVDHPIRRKEAIRDSTVFTAGLTTNITGLHCDIAVLDDVVVEANAYNEEGRNTVRTQASYLASIAGTDSKIWVVGTRYHPKDLYNDFLEMLVKIYDQEGTLTDSYNLYEIFERQVEDRGDGTGNFLWPYQKRYDGKGFGFNQQVLAEKKAQYVDQTKFRAQYYNNPNDIGTSSITPDMFQYYDRNNLYREMGKWYIKQRRLNVFAAIDFAWGLKKASDYSCIVVLGVDSNNNYYIMDIDRFKTNQISEYFERILRLHVKWDFRKIRAEITAAQEVIVKDLKENYIRVHGLALSVEEVKPKGKKEERIEASLQPKYNNKQMWHYNGGNTVYLEEELVQQNPSHDDIKDCLTLVIDACIPPSTQSIVNKEYKKEQMYHPRFGGIM